MVDGPACSKMLTPFLNRNQEFLVENLRRRRTFSYEAKLEMFDDLIDSYVIFDEGDGVQQLTL